jgi:uncharacterized protein (DUF2062 family)
VTKRLTAWFHKQIPSREELQESRYIRPLARRQELWRFTRRSVPRGVAIGLLVGIFALIPGIQIIGAALMCVPGRGNIPIAAGATFLSNPATTPLIVGGALWVGNTLGFHADVATFKAMLDGGASIGDWAAWLLSDAAPALVVGLAVISVVAAAIGYLITSFLWRRIVVRKRQRRLGQAGIGNAGQLNPAE